MKFLSFKFYLILFVCVPFLAVTQTQYSAYTAIGKGVATTFLTDYQSLGINPSALGWGSGYEDKNVTMGTTEFGFSMTSPALDKERLKRASRGLYNNLMDKENNSFDLEAQREAAADFAEAGLAVNADYNWFGFSYQSENFGGVAVSIRESYNWYSKLNENTADIIFRGRLADYFDTLTIVMDGDTSRIANSRDLSQDTLGAVIEGTVSNPLLLSELTDGSEIRMAWNREYNFGYGRKIIGEDSTFALYGGIGGRYIQSMAMFDYSAVEGDVNLSSSVSPFFGIDYGEVELTNPSTFSSESGLLPTVMGNGFGVDIATSIIMLKNIRIAASVNNLGRITYDRDVYTVGDTLVGSLSLPGLNDYDVTDAMSQMLESGSILNLQGQEEIVLQNPATFRLGGSIKLGKKVHVGADLIAPFDRDAPGSIQNPVFSVGGDFKVLDWIHLSAGYFGGGIYQHNIPVGVNFVLNNGAYELGIASRDAISFFVNDSNSFSAAFGFARFRF